MKSPRTTLCSALVASLALAFAAPAFAQDTTPPSSNPSDASDMSMSSGMDDSSTAPATPRRHHRRASSAPAASGIGSAPPSDNPQYNANTANLTGNEPEVRAYQKSDRQRSYPSVDHGHVAGDPPVIDHSSDQAPVDNPTHTSVAVPPQPAPMTQP
jgi:hypothetical protein